ncbi:MAG: hypothetical protein JRF33_15135 [Deltaproteobacteria bacterium]|nr:hypothetical protein [Deltaproteobacteria bacterium]
MEHSSALSGFAWGFGSGFAWGFGSGFAWGFGSAWGSDLASPVLFLSLSVLSLPLRLSGSSQPSTSSAQAVGPTQSRQEAMRQSQNIAGRLSLGMEAPGC